jgi:O-antigen chain-terminating methyltransferase
MQMHSEKLRHHDYEMRVQKDGALALQRRMASVLEQCIHALGAGRDTAKTSAENPYDGLYVDFEDAFRGDYAEVRERLSLYAPLIEQVCKATGSKRLLDLGCGRGEWLDLFTASGYEASGVDLNASMVSLCSARGLDAVQGDVLSELLRLPDATFSAVSMFHLVEHLPFEVVLRVVDEVHRVLRPSGIVIFETPNPRNILVGSGDFYRDPTHRNPVFPDTLAWLGRARGFADSRIFFVDYADQKLIPAEDWRFEALEDYVNVPRDYAWIGTKG